MSLAATLPTLNGGSDARSRLIEIIAEKSLQTGKPIQLVSGRSSGFYFDMKPTALDPEASSIISHLILEILKDKAIDFVGGIEMGAVPIVACLCQMSFGKRPLPGFFVRKESKEHGTRRLIEGVEPQSLRGKNVVVLDDVTTTGGSLLKAVRAAREAGANVETAITVVDRLEGAVKNLSDQHVELIAIATAGDFEI